MHSSNLLEKSKGVLLFAFDSKETSYVNIADQTARLITKNLRLPITLVTDYTTDPKFQYDEIKRVENNSSNFRIHKDNSVEEWRNFNRFSAFDLSPYYETLLLDADYLTLTSNLLQVFDTDFDYKLHYSAISPKSNIGLDSDQNLMGPNSLPFQWATAVFFRKTPISEMFFSLVMRVQKQYNHYRKVFKIPQGSYRNDYAFTIANILLNGYNVDPKNDLFMPMLLIDEPVQDIEIKKNNLIVRYADRADVISRQNLHILNKKFLSSINFYNFVENICNE